MIETAAQALYDRSFKVLGRHMTLDRFELLVDLEASRGARLRTVRGHELLDCYTCFASLPIGWNHPDLADPDFVARLGHIAINKPALSDTFVPEVADFIETFYRFGIPENFPWIFLIDGGGLAVENCLKAAFDWKVRKNLAAGRGELGTKVVHFEQCFHGRTGYTMSMTDSPDPRKTQYYPQFTDWPRIPNPKLHFPLTEDSLGRTIEAEAVAVRRIEEAFAAHPHDIAAIIIEPIQGEGGDNHFRPEFLGELRRLADEHEALLVFDEVQTGVGLTGSFWAWQQLGVEPDLVAFGKKTQVCGLYAGERINEVERNVFVEPSRINSTFGGNLVDCVRFQRVLEVIERDGLVANAARVGAHFLAGLRGMAGDFPDLVTNVRGRGLWLAIDLPDTETRNLALKAAFDEGLFALSCGHRSIRFRPPLTFTAEEADEAVELLARGVRTMADRKARSA